MSISKISPRWNTEDLYLDEPYDQMALRWDHKAGKAYSKHYGKAETEVPYTDKSLSPGVHFGGTAVGWLNNSSTCGKRLQPNSTWTLAPRRFMKTSDIGKMSFRLYRRSKASGASETRYSLRAKWSDIRSLTEVTTTRVGIEPW